MVQLPAKFRRSLEQGSFRDNQFRTNKRLCLNSGYAAQAR